MLYVFLIAITDASGKALILQSQDESKHTTTQSKAIRKFRSEEFFI